MELEEFQNKFEEYYTRMWLLVSKNGLKCEVKEFDDIMGDIYNLAINYKE